MKSSFPIRVLYLSGYSHPIHHRKVELLADTEDLEILNINGLDCDRKSNQYPSANGQRSYEILNLPTAYLFKNDVHRSFYWPPRFQLRDFQPHLIYCEHEQESLMALEASIMRDLFCPRVPLILYTWQNILRRRNWLVRTVSDATLQAAQHIFCASSEGIDVLRRQGYKGGASVVQQMGLDTRYFYPKDGDSLRAELGLGSFVIGFIGRLVPEKGLDTLLIAASQLPFLCDILIVGNGSEEEALHSLSQSLGIANRVHFINSISWDQVVDYMNILDVFVLPSRTTPNWKEQFGRVLVEAMACRVPVVGSDSGAIPEVIGDAGRVFSEGNCEQLSEILAELISSPQLRSELGNNGFNRVQANYTVEKLAEKMLNVWLALAKGILPPRKVDR